MAIPVPWAVATTTHRRLGTGSACSSRAGVGGKAAWGMDLTHFIRKHRGELASACDEAEAQPLPGGNAIACKRGHIRGVLDRIADRVAADDLSPGALRLLATTEAAVRYREGVGLADIVRQ